MNNRKLTYKLIVPEQYDEFLQLTRESAGEYLEKTLQLMSISWDRYTQLFQTIGEVWGIYVDGEQAGYYWIEKRLRELHLHGLILAPEFRGLGIGTQVLNNLENEYRDEIAWIELGVHQTNHRAVALYERQGFEPVKELKELDFIVMQKRISLTKIN